jgi:sugar phosphate isomerase/epimerase
MTCSSHHVRPETLEKNMDQVIADAKALGAVQVVCPILPHKKPLDRAQVLKVAADFNRYGATLKAAGLRFAYHNHAGDFMVTDSPAAPGETFYDVLIAATEPGVVSFQLDVFWVAWGGAKAADVIEKHGQRICSLHLKDLARDAKPDTVQAVIQAFRIGDLGIASIPFEVFTEIGLEIKARSPFKDTFTIELANGSNGYLPTPKHHDLGGYETWLGTNRVEREASVKITARALEMLERVK